MDRNPAHFIHEELIMAMSNAERAYLDARSMLALEKNKDRVSRTLQSRGMKAGEAADLVDQVYRDNQATNRKSALGKILLSGLGLVVFGGVFLFTGRLFFIILPIVAIGFLWGIISFLTAPGYEIAVDNSDD
jgi:uncharacterized protein YoaH (UPF0181 family)